MRDMIFRDDTGAEWERVDKRTARRAYKDGQELCIVPCKIRPFGVWWDGRGFRMDGTDPDPDRSFDRLINSFEWYNCGSELGYYASYYIRKE